MAQPDEAQHLAVHRNNFELFAYFLAEHDHRSAAHADPFGLGYVMNNINSGQLGIERQALATGFLGRGSFRSNRTCNLSHRRVTLRGRARKIGQIRRLGARFTWGRCQHKKLGLIQKASLDRIGFAARSKLTYGAVPGR